MQSRGGSFGRSREKSAHNFPHFTRIFLIFFQLSSEVGLQFFNNALVLVNLSVYLKKKFFVIVVAQKMGFKHYSFFLNGND